MGSALDIPPNYRTMPYAEFRKVYRGRESGHFIEDALAHGGGEKLDTLLDLLRTVSEGGKKALRERIGEVIEESLNMYRDDCELDWNDKHWEDEA